MSYTTQQAASPHAPNASSPHHGGFSAGISVANPSQPNPYPAALDYSSQSAQIRSPQRGESSRKYVSPNDHSDTLTQSRRIIGTTHTPQPKSQNESSIVRPPVRRRSSVDLAFITQFSQALLQMESTLDTENSLEGSQHRVRRLFQFHDSLHTKHDIELIERDEQALSEITLNDVTVPKEDEVQEKAHLLEETVQGKVKRVMDLSEKFQHLYKIYEETIHTKPAVQVELEQTVNDLNEKLQHIEFQLYEKDNQLQTEVDNLRALKNKASKMERMYLKEKKRKEILLKGVGFVPDDGVDASAAPTDTNSSPKKKKRKRKERRSRSGEDDENSGEDESESSEQSEDEGSSTDSNSEAASLHEKTDSALKEIISSSKSQNDEVSNLKNSGKVEESYVRFVDGFSHRLEAYEAEKLLTQHQINELKAIVRDKDEAMGEHMRKLERVVALKDQQLIAEREKFRKMFLHQLTREDQSVARLKAKLESDGSSGRSHRKGSGVSDRKKSWADHRKRKLIRMDGGMDGRNSGRGSRKNSTAGSSTLSTPISPLSDSDDDLSSYRFGGSSSSLPVGGGGPGGLAGLQKRKNSIRPPGLEPFLQAAERKLKDREQKDAAAKKDGKANLSLVLEDHNHNTDTATRKAKIEKKSKKLKKAYKKMQRRVEDIQKRLEVYDNSSKPKDGVQPMGEVGPYGRVVLVFTDIQGSTNLWERSISDMTKALEIHNEIIRRALKETGGFEVKTEGDAFMSAFSSSFMALEFAMLVQMRLLEGNWPQGIYKAPEACIERDVNGQIMWRGVRVRMGLHIGEPIVQKDPTTNREDYFGPMVNKSARIEGCAQGGEVCVSDDFWRDVKNLYHNEEERKKWTFTPWIRKVSSVTLKGIPGKETVRSILPEKLQNRQFAPAPAPKKDEPSSPNNDIFNTVKNLRKQVEELVRESEVMRQDMQSNDLRKELAEREEMIEFLSMEMLSQEREMQHLANLKESEINLLKEEMVNIRRSVEADAKRLTKIKEKEVKKKYQMNATDMKQLNHQMKFMTRQRDTFQKKFKDLQYSLIEANDTIADLKQQLRRLKTDLKMQKMKVKKSKFFKGNDDTTSDELLLPKLTKPRRSLVETMSAPSISVAADAQNTEENNDENEEDQTDFQTPRYMKHLTRRVKSDVKTWVNPLWQTVQNEEPTPQVHSSLSRETRQSISRTPSPLKLKKSKTMHSGMSPGMALGHAGAKSSSYLF